MVTRLTNKMKEKPSQQTQPPVDIDVALDNMSGRSFADSLNSYLTNQNQSPIAVGMVLANPEKSKHLETATMKVGKFWIDFVNLRAESYAENSRIPELMRIGTPAEDAFRRDLTINSLFYNLETRTVEDLTGRGIQDLLRGVIATPLAPTTTFLDDPLRVLRAVRFAARLRFILEPDLQTAASSPAVKTALSQKVSRERVGAELDLMMRSADPVCALRLITTTLSLAAIVFPLPPLVSATASRNAYADGLATLAKAHEYLDTHDYSRTVIPSKIRRLLWYAAYLSPLSCLEEGAVQPRKSLTSVTLFESLKRPTRDCDDVLIIQNAAKRFSACMEEGGDLSATAVLLSDVEVEVSSDSGLPCRQGSDAARDTTDPIWKHAMEFRLQLASIIRSAGPFWRAGLVLSLSQRLQQLNEILEDEAQYEMEEADEIQRNDTLEAAIIKLGLLNVHEQMPLIDGRELQTAVLRNIPRGPTFAAIVEKQMDWIIMHPAGEKQELAEFLMDEFKDFK